MTLEHAIAVRALQLQGKPVAAGELHDALETIERHKPRPKGGRRPKFRLPLLCREERQRLNLVLMFNLGKALGQ